MSPHQTVAVAVRLFAVWFAIYVMREASAFYLQGRAQRDPYVLLIVLGVLALALAFIAVLWFFPRSIAQGLLPGAGAQPQPPASADTWLAMGCGLIGLWLLTSALPALTRNSLLLYLYRDAGSDTTNLRIGLYYYSAELVVAAWLICGARGFRKIFWWLRNAGRPAD